MVLAIAMAALAVPRYCSAAAVLRVTARSPVRMLRAATSLQVRYGTCLFLMFEGVVGYSA